MPVPFHELVTAAYCPRQLYYARRADDREPPPDVESIRALAFDYPSLLDAADATLEARPVAVAPAAFRSRLARLRDRLDCFDALADPAERRVLVTGKDCHGVVHKVVATGDGPVPAMASAGAPPDDGVWEPDAVRAVAAALALAWREESSVERALVEYPAHAVVREVPVTARRRARYRRVLRTVRALDGPPPRLHDDAKCGACDYRATCGTRTRTLASLLGL